MNLRKKLVSWKSACMVLSVGFAILLHAYVVKTNSLDTQITEEKAVASKFMDKWVQCEKDRSYNKGRAEKEEESEAILEETKAKILNLKPWIRARDLHAVAPAIIKYSKEYEVDRDLVISIAYHESRFNKHAVSPVGAIGVMQVMPFWANDLDYVGHPQKLFEPETNIRAGVEIYKHYLNMFHGDTELALLAYNRGPGSVRLALHRKSSPSNGYEKDVLRHKNRLENM